MVSLVCFLTLGFAWSASAARIPSDSAPIYFPDQPQQHSLSNRRSRSLRFIEDCITTRMVIVDGKRCGHADLAIPFVSGDSSLRIHPLPGA